MSLPQLLRVSPLLRSLCLCLWFFIPTLCGAAQLPATVTGLKVEIANKPTAWKTVEWVAVENDIHIYYAGDLYKSDGTAENFSINVVFTGQDGHLIQKVEATDYGKKPVASHTESNVSLSAAAAKSLSYTVIDGSEQKISGKVTFVSGDLTIFDGQRAAAAVAEKDEETIGAFTVANLNDTDGDGKVDKDDDTVKKVAAGDDEEDLMECIIKGPKVGRMKVTVVSGSVEFWEKSTKETKIAKQGDAIFINAADLPKTVWVETTNYSNAVRDIELRLGHEPPAGQLIDNVDTVKATAVWAEKTGTKSANADALWADADDATFKDTFNNIVGTFGINYATPTGFLRYSIGFEFTVKPTGIGNEAKVKFDITRQIEKKYWARKAGGAWAKAVLPWETFDAADVANSDPPDEIDEDVVPTKDHIYVINGPGRRNKGGIDEFVAKLNFNEFVRVSVNGTRPTGENATGSRGSNKIPWHAHYWVQGDGTKYTQVGGKENSVAEGHLALGGDDAP